MTEQEARGLVFESLGAHDQRLASGLTPNLAHFNAALDTLITAVRAETLREVRGVIADVKAGGEDFADNADEKFGWDQACDCVHNSLALKDTLDALAHPEGTDQ
jgi:hypothetical protein